MSEMCFMYLCLNVCALSSDIVSDSVLKLILRRLLFMYGIQLACKCAVYIVSLRYTYITAQWQQLSARRGLCNEFTRVVPG